MDRDAHVTKRHASRWWRNGGAQAGSAAVTAD
jgi:hypothetical protein